MIENESEKSRQLPEPAPMTEEWANRAEPEKPRYRVGRHQPQNLYDGDKYIGVMFSAPQAARVVDALNEQERRTAAEKWSG